MKVKYLLFLVIAVLTGFIIWAVLNMGDYEEKNLTFQFAITGSNKNILKEPNFAVTDQKGNIYVSDSRNNRVAVFSKNGRFLYHIGGAGSKKPLTYPMGLGILKDTIIVADSGAGVIYQYSVKGKFLKAWKCDTPIKPAGVYVDSNRHVYITDIEGEQILVFSDKGQLKQKIKPNDSSLGSPLGISLDTQGNLWVADSSNYNIKVISADGQLKNMFDGGPKWPLSMAKGLAVDKMDRIYVTDTLSGVVRVFDRYGNGIASFGSAENENKLQFPIGIYADENKIYVVDQGSSQVQVWAWK